MTINHDPAGYVYEAVPSNRVEGVQATIYYKEETEDMYGDKQVNEVMWDAEEYAQKNPLFTDANGVYQWDVPQGLWRVKFEKDGYETTYSEWLPVPPPQLEVNIAITQKSQPEVSDVHAYEQAVEITFDKYMDPTTMEGNIYLTADGVKKSGTVEMVDATSTVDGSESALQYATRFRFVPDESLTATSGVIKIFVSRDVKSYAGIPMTETFSQELDIEKEITDIEAEDDLLQVLYGGSREVTISVSPYDAAVGRTLRVVSASSMIASIDAEEYVLDENGQAVVNISGILPGTTNLSLSVDGTKVTGSSTINVVTELYEVTAPVASRASGTQVYRGTAITLSTSVEDATIYYTLDGSCPCDEDSRLKYTNPISVTDDIEIHAITVTANNEESEAAVFAYTIRKADIDFSLAEGWSWISHNLYNGIEPSALAGDDVVERILSQNAEVVRDEKYGLVGTLTQLTADKMYKVESSADASRERLSDDAWNPATPIAVKAGWNWIGYPQSQTMTVAEALSTTEPTTEDVITSLTGGFAQFDGTDWVGTLETLTPGEGYIYRAMADNKVIYNTNIVSYAAARAYSGVAARAPWAVDSRRYPEVMNLVAVLVDADDMEIEAGTYEVGAFCGSECRGVGQYVNGMLMMSIHGNSGDAITFRLMDADEQTYSTDETMTMAETTVGSVLEPYRLSIEGAVQGISDIAANGRYSVSAVDRQLRVKGDLEALSGLCLIDMKGARVMGVSRVTSAPISLAGLPAGVYVVELRSGSQYSYYKISIK
ncbi:MAG: chitobiase/beta-hexosaminidase C-terminal domain-containing protein [Bacteroidales bacterium]|nr:chitobiase/beta-hexosaminidase C-terminal domain-containing protein [Bacteroidales bacterium]